MKRTYEIITGNGEVWGVPAEVIADNYAKYYEGSGEDYKENYDAMIEWFDTGDFEFADWAKNNMDWDDVKQQAFLVRRGESDNDFQESWVNGEYYYVKERDKAKNPENVPTNDGWIPVEERLPEDEAMMLVTCKTKAGRLFVNRAWYGDGSWHGTGTMSGVIAWRPLPEPYRGEE